MAPQSAIAILETAARVLAGEERLAKILDVPVESLQAWLDGSEPPPRNVVLHALAIASYQSQLEDVGPVPGSAPAPRAAKPLF